VYVLETEDVYRDISNDVDVRFDTSEFQAYHPSGIIADANRRSPGVMKHEASGEIVEEFVGLRAKLYSFKTLEDSKEHKGCKRVKKTLWKTNYTQGLKSGATRFANLRWTFSKMKADGCSVHAKYFLWMLLK